MAKIQINSETILFLNIFFIGKAYFYYLGIFLKYGLEIMGIADIIFKSKPTFGENRSKSKPTLGENRSKSKPTLSENRCKSKPTMRKVGLNTSQKRLRYRLKYR